MREYERLREEGKLSQLQKFAFGLSNGSKGTASNRVKDDVTTSSAGDVGSDSSFSDVQVHGTDDDDTQMMMMMMHNRDDGDVGGSDSYPDNIGD